MCIRDRRVRYADPDWPIQEITFYHQRPESETWEILPTVVDAEMGTLSTTIEQSERLALAPYDEDFNYLKGLMTPSVTGLQTSLWTGDSTFSYPLQLPPGPAQATPALGLISVSYTHLTLPTSDLV